MLEKEIFILLKKIKEYNSLNPKEVKYEIKSGIDTLVTRLDNEVDILITSPPYLQAQEYIRSTKLELFWLGFDELYIKELSKKEIPYRDVKKIEIYSSKYYEFREKIKEKHLKDIYDKYFYAILDTFSKLGENVKNYMCIFVGPAKIRTTPIPIDEIIIEHLQKFGWKHEITFIDTIVSRVMFESKINPASGQEDNRIKTEHLVVLKRKWTMYQILQTELNNSNKFRSKFRDFIVNLKEFIIKKYNVIFTEEEIGDLLLSICRMNEFNVIKIKQKKKLLAEENVFKWIKEKLIPNTVFVKLDDEDVIRLLIFCMEITYQMFGGGTRATVTQKGFRERRRTFESILVDQFIGKLGEVFVKKYLENKFPVTIELDWEISPQIEKYRNDIINANKKISIKSSPTLTGVWAEADLGYDYGIMVKCSVPQQPILQFFIEVCGFSRLLNFADNKIPSDDKLFKNYLKELRGRIEKYKCETIQTELKGYICGYFKTSKNYLVRTGEKLPHLGTVKEERYLIPIKDLKWSYNMWEKFLKDVKLL